MKRRAAILGLIGVATLMAAAPARAELVFFSTGRVLSVKAHRTEGESVVLTLRSGGEMICEQSIVARIEPDEIPYPEDKPLAEETAYVSPDAAPLEASAQLQTDARYEPIIVRVAAQHGIDPTLVRAVIQVESNYETRARSIKGARGLMQLMPDTARRYGVSNLYDPAANIEAGIRHLKFLLDRFPLTLALAAYNAGEAAVERFGGVPPYAETRSYVARILQLVGRKA
jgi:transglycosylase-like protein with SLT domain